MREIEYLVNDLQFDVWKIFTNGSTNDWEPSVAADAEDSFRCRLLFWLLPGYCQSSFYGTGVGFIQTSHTTVQWTLEKNPLNDVFKLLLFSFCQFLCLAFISSNK